MKKFNEHMSEEVDGSIRAAIADAIKKSLPFKTRDVSIIGNSLADIKLFTNRHETSFGISFKLELNNAKDMAAQLIAR